MACFVAPVTEAVISTVAARALKRSEKNSAEVGKTGAESAKTPLSVKLGWLNKMLWGGSALLAFEHLWHGEITPFFPFFTAVKDGNVEGMLAEIGSVGVCMSLAVTAVWGVAVAVSCALEKKNAVRARAEDAVG